MGVEAGRLLIGLRDAVSPHAPNGICRALTPIPDPSPLEGKGDRNDSGGEGVSRAFAPSASRRGLLGAQAAARRSISAVRASAWRASSPEALSSSDEASLVCTAAALTPAMLVET